jgi:hypothetical protein
MECVIKSKKLGRTLTFSRPGSSHIYVDLNGQPGFLGRQICAGGATSGSTLEYSGNCETAFKYICRSWHRSYVRYMNKLGLCD